MSHPTTERLRAYLRGDPTSAEKEHVEGCADCLAALERASGGGSGGLDADLRQAAALPEFPETCWPAAKPSPSTGDPFANLPSQIGKYTLLRPLGRGGMGFVSLAQHEELETLWAVKLLPAGHANTAWFLRERKAAARLRHPNLVLVIDAGRDAGFEYFVMDYVVGQSFHQLVEERGPLPVEVACALLSQAALGLAHIHAQDVVHRDVKPANLMLARSGEVKVLDLGLARVPAAADSPPSLGPGETCGTPDYLAPEQARGAHDVDARADLYALGCVLYHLLAGFAPFEAVQGALAKLHAHQVTPIPPLSRTDLSAEVRALLTELLAKEPGQRVPSAVQLAQRLQPLAVGCDLADWFASPTAHLAVQPTGAFAAYPAINRHEPLQAALDIRFWDPQTRQSRSLREQGVLPVCQRHKYQLDVRLNRPAHVYLLWINPRGEVAPIYPWKAGSKWEPEHPDEPIHARLLLPRPTEKGYGRWGLTADGGVETVVLLAREEPLSKQEHVKFTSWVANLPATPALEDPSRPQWFDCTCGISATRGFDPCVEISDDLSFQMESLLLDRFAGRFDLGRGVQFTNLGGSQ